MGIISSKLKKSHSQEEQKEQKSMNVIKEEKQSKPAKDSAKAFGKLGDQKYRQKNFKGALSEYTKAIAITPENAVLYANRAEAHRSLGNHLKAIAEYHQAILIKPDFAEAHNGLGCSKFALAKTMEAKEEAQILYQEAAEAFKMATQYKPNYTSAHNNSGTAKKELGDYEGAIESYTQAIQLRSDYPLAYDNRATVYKELKRHENADADSKYAHFIRHQHTPQVQLNTAIRRNHKALALKYLHDICEQKSDKPPFILTRTGETPIIFVLAQFGRTSWLTEFLKHIPWDVLDAEGNGVLHIAAYYGQFKFYAAVAAEDVLAIPTDNPFGWPTNHAGETPFHIAARNGQVDFLFQCHEKYNLEQEIQAKTADGQTIVHLIAQQRDVNLLKELLFCFPFLSQSSSTIITLASLQKAPFSSSLTPEKMKEKKGDRSKNQLKSSDNLVSDVYLTRQLSSSISSSPSINVTKNAPAKKL